VQEQFERQRARSATSFHNAGSDPGTYAEKNPSACITFDGILLGRSYANNVTNALLRPLTFGSREKEGH